MEQLTENPFTPKQLEEINDMMNSYNNLYKSLEELEGWVQYFLAEQKKSSRFLGRNEKI